MFVVTHCVIEYVFLCLHVLSVKKRKNILKECVFEENTKEEKNSIKIIYFYICEHREMSSKPFRKAKHNVEYFAQHDNDNDRVYIIEVQSFNYRNK